MFGAFFDVIETLGWRVSAVCRLWASDVDRSVRPVSPYGRIRKRGEVDKEGVEMWVPMNEDALLAVDMVLERNPAIGDTPLFPAPKSDPDARTKSWSRWHVRDLHERAQRAAGHGYSCPTCETYLGNEQRECPKSECGHVDRLPRDPAKKLLGFHAYRVSGQPERKPSAGQACRGGRRVAGHAQPRAVLPTGGRGEDTRRTLRAPEAA